MSQFPVNSRLAGYEIFELVGKGGMGEVYRARQVSMDRIVALKVLSTKLARQDPSFATRFVDEARAAGRLNNPNIVAVHDVGKTTIPRTESTPPGIAEEEIHYFSMEYVDGETVKDVIVRDGACKMALTDQVMSAMAEALVYAEGMGVVHRDIKPDNIMVTSSGAVKLADLGLAQQMGSEEGLEGGADAPRKVMGTPMYMSPEQARGLPVDGRSDQYSLGATLYHMLTGQPPFKGENSKAIMRAHVFDPVPDPATAHQVSESWRQLCMRLMAKTPDERFASAAEMRSAVKHAIAGQPLPGVSKRLRQTKTSLKHEVVHPTVAAPSSAGLKAVVLLVVLVGGAAGAFFAFGPGGGKPPPPPPPHQTDPQPTHRPDDSAAVRAKALIAKLPAEPDKAVAKLEEHLADASLADPAARELFQAEMKKQQAALAEQNRALKEAQLAKLKLVDAATAAGHLGEAKDGLAALAKEQPLLVQDKLPDSVAKLLAAVQTLAVHLQDAAAKAGKPEDLDSVLGELKASPIEGDARTKLQALIEARRGELTKLSAAVAAASQEKALWLSLNEAMEKSRYSARYPELTSAVEQEGEKFTTPEVKEQVLHLADLGRFATKAEGFLRKHIAARTPLGQVRVNGETKSVKFVELKDKEILYLVKVGPTYPPDVKTADRQALVGVRGLLEQALGNLPVGAADPHWLPAFLWVWKPVEAKALFAKLEGDPLADAVAALDAHNRILEVHPAVRREGTDLVVPYTFADKDPGLLNDFTGAQLGPNCSFTDRGLLWTNNKPVVGTSEAALPTLHWKVALNPPLTLEANLFLQKDSLSALVGVQCDDRLVRIGFNTKTIAGSVVVGALVSDDAGNFKLLVDPNSTTTPPQVLAAKFEYSATVPVKVEAIVGADYQVTLKFNGTALIQGVALPKGKPISAVFQTYQNAAKGAQSGMEISSVTIQGAAP